MGNIWAIVLAAGTSTRMKKQKMLLPFNGKTIVETVVENCVSVFGSNVAVVVGSHRDAIINQLELQPVTICENENFRNGMLSSVICGFRCVPEDTEGVMLFLGDQPQIPKAVALNVKDAWTNSGKGIIIPTFNGKRGHPVMIDTKYKNEIEKLDPEKGLRELMLANPIDVLETECVNPEILRDIDTPEDYLKEKKLK